MKHCGLGKCWISVETGCLDQARSTVSDHAVCERCFTRSWTLLEAFCAGRRATSWFALMEGLQQEAVKLPSFHLSTEDTTQRAVTERAPGSSPVPAVRMQALQSSPRDIPKREYRKEDAATCFLCLRKALLHSLPLEKQWKGTFTFQLFKICCFQTYFTVSLLIHFRSQTGSPVLLRMQPESALECKIIVLESNVEVKLAIIAEITLDEPWERCGLKRWDDCTLRACDAAQFTQLLSDHETELTP